MLTRRGFLILIFHQKQPFLIIGALYLSVLLLTYQTILKKGSAQWLSIINTRSKYLNKPQPNFTSLHCPPLEDIRPYSGCKHDMAYRKDCCPS